jgi:hypothetical protein
MDATEERAELLAQAFYGRITDRDGNPPRGRVRMLEKTPKNALRVPFFDAIWPDSVFVYLYRDVRQALASMIEAWTTGAFRTYPRLPGWIGYPWSLLLIPGWRELIGQPLPAVVAHQWATTTKILLQDLQNLPRDRIRAIEYDAFLSEPNRIARALSESLGLSWDREIGVDLPLSKTTVSPPAPDKWRRFESDIEKVLPIVRDAEESARTFLRRFGD